MKSKKRILALLICLTLSLTAVTTGITAFAASSDWEYDNESKVLTIKADTQNYTQGNYTDVPWEQYKAEVESIVIKDGVSSIGDFAFCFAGSLKSVTLPKGLSYIGTAAFAGCDKLMTLNIPDSVSSIGDNAFGYNSQMQLTDGFVAGCSANSYAQSYCLANYIMFDSPINLGESTAEIKSANAQCIWSFTPKTNCTVSFSSSGSSDTYGLIYDASTYVYSSSFDTMCESAVAENDDIDDDLNFNISYDLSAGKRYYLAAKYKDPTETGSYTVNFSFTCKEHIYTREVITPPSCETEGQSCYTCIGCGHTYYERIYATGHSYEVKSFDGEYATIGCKDCDSEFKLKFIDYCNTSNTYLDVVEDGVVNAKDYAKLYLEYRK